MTEQQAAKADESSSKLPWLLGGCCACLGLVGLLVFGAFALGGLTYLGVQSATEPAAAVARDFVAKTALGDYAGAQALCHPSLSEKLGADGLKTMVEANPDLLRLRSESLSFTSRSFQNGVVRLLGTATNEKGESKHVRYVVAGGLIVGFKSANDPIPMSDEAPTSPVAPPDQAAPAAALARNFLARMTAGEIAEAHALLHEKLQEQVTLEGLRTMAAKNPDLFQVKVETVAFERETVGSDGFVRLLGTLSNAKGSRKHCRFVVVPTTPPRLIGFRVADRPLAEHE